MAIFIRFRRRAATLCSSRDARLFDFTSTPLTFTLIRNDWIINLRSSDMIVELNYPAKSSLP